MGAMRRGQLIEKRGQLTEYHDHYYVERPMSEIKEKTFRQEIRGKSLQFTSVSGVFSFGRHVDRASALLAEAFKPSGKTVLDLGCGYGAIGLFIKAIHPDQAVILSDINVRAVEYAKQNALMNRLDVKVVKSDLFSAFEGAAFDDIVTNPPVAAGKKLIGGLIDKAFAHLNPGGALWLVAYHNKGGSTLRKIMEERFSNAEDIVKSGGVRVYRAIKPTGGCA